MYCGDKRLLLKTKLNHLNKAFSWLLFHFLSFLAQEVVIEDSVEAKEEIKMEVDEPASEVNVEVKEDTEPETKVRFLDFLVKLVWSDKGQLK